MSALDVAKLIEDSHRIAREHGRTCTRCEKRKQAGEFTRRPNGKLFERCKTCRAEVQREHHAANRDYYAKFDKARSKLPGRVETLRRADKRRRVLHPEKPAARSAVKYALSTGRLKRQPCEGCGAKKAQAHHDDYQKPLDVRWLCHDCHRKEHRT